VQLGPVTHLSAADVEALWVNNGGDPSKALTAAAIVFSSENPAGNAGLVNDTASTGDYSVGLWQINYAGDLLSTRTAQFGSPEALAADPNLQARAAIAMSANGTNWQAWGPDFGASDYSRPVTSPTPGSRVGRWLAAHGGGVESVSVGGLSGAHATMLSVGIVAVAGAVVWAITEGFFDGMRVPTLADFGLARENPVRSRERDLPPMYVQSLLFPRDRYNVPMAKAWARNHDYRTSQIELTDHYIHLVQTDPGQLRVIRTVEFGKGIKAHVGRES
jgi:hypothetical protein